jgi:hypothetical protein
VTPGTIDPRTILVWVPSRLPNGLAAEAARVPGVQRVAEVIGGTAWMTASISPAGERLEPDRGFAIPIEIAAADPAAYGALLPAQDRGAIARLARPGTGIAAQEELTLRREPIGSTFVFGPERILAAAALPPRLLGDHELFVSRVTAATLGLTTPKYLLVRPDPDAPLPRVEAALRALVAGASPFLVAPAGRVPFLRDSPNTLPALFEKLAMGEFAARMLSGGDLLIDPAWRATHIVTATVPIVGRVTCNRAFVPALRAALAEVVIRGLAGSIHASGYAGCYVPRFVLRDTTQLISHHAWGSAVDLNAPENPFGVTPHMDPRVVSIFAAFGFRWGGGWLIPDGMHFEFSSPAPVRMLPPVP